MYSDYFTNKVRGKRPENIMSKEMNVLLKIMHCNAVSYCITVLCCSQSMQRENIFIITTFQNIWQSFRSKNDHVHEIIHCR